VHKYSGTRISWKLCRDCRRSEFAKLDYDLTTKKQAEDVLEGTHL
jgi:hypothetical protein